MEGFALAIAVVVIGALFNLGWNLGDVLWFWATTTDQEEADGR